MKYRLVQCVEGRFITSEFDDTNVIPAIEARGYSFSRQNFNHRTRAELQGAPVFSGLAGPMWDGNAVRYEDTEATIRLSA